MEEVGSTWSCDNANRPVLYINLNTVWLGGCVTSLTKLDLATPTELTGCVLMAEASRTRLHWDGQNEKSAGMSPCAGIPTPPGSLELRTQPHRTGGPSAAPCFSRPPVWGTALEPAPDAARSSGRPRVHRHLLEEVADSGGLRKPDREYEEKKPTMAQTPGLKGPDNNTYRSHDWTVAVQGAPGSGQGLPLHSLPAAFPGTGQS